MKSLANEALSADIRIDSIQTSGITDDSQISDTTESEAAKQVIDHKKSYSYNVSKRDFYKMLYAGVPLIGAGLSVHASNENFKSFRNEYAKQYNTHYDDILQYTPGMVMLGMKALGVKGRSSWGRMAVSDAFSIALMASVVNTLKHTVHERRPDGSNSRSFPSGHTATAFMCATMLHKEYGHISPWISIGGYTVATATGVSRILNNKHWISDVMVGAGIGILSTEMGNFLTDLIFKDKGLHKFELPERYDRWHKPSFLGLYVGYNISGSKFDTPVGQIKMKLGMNAGFEGAYYFNPYLGVGGRINFADMPLQLNREILPHDIEFNSASAGVYLSYPFSSWIHLSAKVLGGFNHFSRFSIAEGYRIGGNNSGVFSTGVSVVLMTSRAFNLRFFCDYNTMHSFVHEADHSLHTVTAGSTLGVNF
ncbi:MAG: phosphatase PAP2 family protein [Muribaculaceae bacterium]|nr:phosphatase PAP2 family protein [Muribaculaceae bacterium]